MPSNSQTAAGVAEDQTANKKNEVERFYINCGRWQLGSTDFVLISKFDILLCSWLPKPKKDFTKPGPKGTTIVENWDAIAHKQQWKPKLEKIRSYDPALAKFFDNKTDRAFIWNYEKLAIDPNNAQNKEFVLSDKLVVVVPDCHITMFKDWTLDGFCTPEIEGGKESACDDNGYPLYPVSLAKEFVEFLNHCIEKTGQENIVHIGDLRDYWHTQWMFELAFDIYREKLIEDIRQFNKSKDESGWSSWHDWAKSSTESKRFPTEILADPGSFKASPNTTESPHKPHYDWWRHFHGYLGISQECAYWEDTEKFLREVALKWPKKIAPLDVVAILWWGLDLKWYATPLDEEEFNSIYDLMDSLEDQDSWLKSLFWSAPDAAHPGYQAIDKLKKSMKCGSEPLDFTDFSVIEERIDKQYEEIGLGQTLNSVFKTQNYVRGNHDCLTPNEYINCKFNLGLSESQLYKKFLKEGRLQDCGDTLVLPPDITLRMGEGQKVLIEHGDAWDLNNNDLNYYLFLEGKVIDGGYQTPKSLTKYGPSYNKQQLESPGSILHGIFKRVGDSGLESPANDRYRSIFKAFPEVRVIVMGHTHIPRLERYELSWIDKLLESF